MALPKTVRRYILGVLERVAPIVPDKMYLHIKYYCRMGKKLNLKNPQTFNEKLQWLKLYGRRPIDTVLSDKYAVKEYISKTIGPEYVIPLIGVWDKFDDIDFDKLPNQFVLKCTHDSGGLVICKDKSKLDIEAARKKINKCLQHDYYVYSREKAYKDIPRRIIAEEYMEDTQTCELRDYKFFCFDGVAKALFIASERQKDGEETKFDFFDMDFRHIPVKNGHPNADVPPAKPETFEEMQQLAAKLSKGIPHVRVDFYEVNGKAYFGEMTYSHWGGMTPFEPDEYDKTFGDWIKLSDETGGGILLIHNNIVLHMVMAKPLDLVDYKVHCFNGEPKFVLLCKDRYAEGGLTEDFYTTEWEHMPVCRPNHPNSAILANKPKELAKILELSKILSKDLPFVRADFYIINQRVYFGEMTFSPAAGMTPFVPNSYDKLFGNWIKL